MSPTFMSPVAPAAPRRWPVAVLGRSAGPRRGVSLLELVAVTVLLGAFAAVAANRSNGLFADAAARTEVERFAGLLHDAKRRAILTGDSHRVAWTRSGGAVASAQLDRETAPGTWTAVEDAVVVPAGLTVTSNVDDVTFSFEGIPAGAGDAVTFTGPNQAWRIQIPPLTGAVRIEQL